MPNDERIIAEEIRRMGEFITKARGEVSAIITAKDSAGAEKNINHIAIELEEVVRHTEEATNTIMDHAEALQKISSADAAVANHAMAIMEACSFQDITGQRVKKVLQIIEQVEMRIDNLVALLGGDIDASAVETLKTGKERADEHLMAGPQLKGEGVSQADVDKLFE
jgi:chemotaxis protein CheZ